MRIESRVLTLAILAFHKIGEPPSEGWRSWFYISEETFVDYLSYLRDDGWQVIDVGRFIGALAEPDNLPERIALLTFDDVLCSRSHFLGCAGLVFQVCSLWQRITLEGATLSMLALSRRKKFVIGMTYVNWSLVESPYNLTEPHIGGFLSLILLNKRTSCTGPEL
jgi:hypothetical protein